MKLSLDIGSAKEQIIQAKKELFNLRFQKAQSTLSNPIRIRVLRRTVARLKTYLNSTFRTEQD